MSVEHSTLFSTVHYDIRHPDETSLRYVTLSRTTKECSSWKEHPISLLLSIELLKQTMKLSSLFALLLTLVFVVASADELLLLVADDIPAARGLGVGRNSSATESDDSSSPRGTGKLCDNLLLRKQVSVRRCCESQIDHSLIFMQSRIQLKYNHRRPRGIQSRQNQKRPRSIQIQQNQQRQRRIRSRQRGNEIQQK